MSIPVYDYAIRYCLTRLSYAYGDGLQLANDHWDELAESTQRDVLDAIARDRVDPARYPRLDHEVEHREGDDSIHGFPLRRSS